MSKTQYIIAGASPDLLVPPFDPENYDNLKIWLKADTGISGTTDVTTWNDSKNSYNHTKFRKNYGFGLGTAKVSYSASQVDGFGCVNIPAGLTFRSGGGPHQETACALANNSVASLFGNHALTMMGVFKYTGGSYSNALFSLSPDSLVLTSGCIGIAHNMSYVSYGRWKSDNTWAVGSGAFVANNSWMFFTLSIDANGIGVLRKNGGPYLTLSTSKTAGHTLSQSVIGGIVYAVSPYGYFYSEPISIAEYMLVYEQLSGVNLANFETYFKNKFPSISWV